jgi:diguanylate cyclase (GGDEF)-like protein
LAITDTLTGLWNRRHFEERVGHEIIKANRYKQPLSVLIFDIDHFKSVNDSYGHLVGDRVLVELCKMARQHTRDSDLLARWGGEEFIMLMPNTGPNEAMAVTEKLRANFASHHFADAGRITASFGIAPYQPGESVDHWISRADAALYEAKQEGRNTVKIAHV